MKKSISITAMAALALAASGGGYAQQVPGTVASGTPSVSARSLISQFEKNTGASVTASDALDLNRSVPSPPGLFDSRTRLMNNIAGAIGANWRKTWVVTPAGPGKSTVDADYLRTVIDSSSSAGFDVTNLPAAEAIATAAKADGADLQIVGAIPATLVTIHDPNMDIADAIASVSRQTNTNWSLTYRMWPASPPESAAGTRQLHINNYARYLQEQAKINSPVSVHFQYPSTGPDPDIYASIMARSLDAPTITGPSVTTPLSQLSTLGGYGYNNPVYVGNGLTTGLNTLNTISPFGVTNTTNGVTTVTNGVTTNIGNQSGVTPLNPGSTNIGNQTGATSGTTGTTNIGNQSGATSTTGTSVIGNQPGTTTGK